MKKITKLPMKNDTKTSKKIIARKPDVPRITYNNGSELYAFFNENKEKVETHIINSIRFGIENNLDGVDLFELRRKF